MTTFSKICTIRSRVTERPEDIIGFAEGGLYELEVKASLSEAAASGSPQAFIQKEIAKALAGCIADTGIPLGVGMWTIEFTNFIYINFNFPEGTIVA